jgi:hypothetical protein
MIGNCQTSVVSSASIQAGNEKDVAECIFQIPESLSAREDSCKQVHGLSRDTYAPKYF